MDPLSHVHVAWSKNEALQDHQSNANLLTSIIGSPKYRRNDITNILKAHNFTENYHPEYMPQIDKAIETRFQCSTKEFLELSPRKIYSIYDLSIIFENNNESEIISQLLNLKITPEDPNLLKECINKKDFLKNYTSCYLTTLLSTRWKKNENGNKAEANIGALMELFSNQKIGDQEVQKFLLENKIDPQGGFIQSLPPQISLMRQRVLAELSHNAKKIEHLQINQTVSDQYEGIIADMTVRINEGEEKISDMQKTIDELKARLAAAEIKMDAEIQEKKQLIELVNTIDLECRDATSLELFGKDAVISPSGHTFGPDSVTWIKATSINPLNQQKLEAEQLLPNLLARNLSSILQTNSNLYQPKQEGNDAIK